LAKDEALTEYITTNVSTIEVSWGEVWALDSRILKLIQ